MQRRFDLAQVCVQFKEHILSDLLGEADGAALVRCVVEDYAFAIESALPALAAAANSFVPEDWQLYPG